MTERLFGMPLSPEEIAARERGQVLMGQEKLAESERRERHDPLTGALNRTGLEKELEHVLDDLTRSAAHQKHVETELTQKQPEKREEEQFFIAFVDLDNFKAVNDAFGHHAGDHVIKEAVAAIRTAFRRDVDVIARYGGDEFVIAAYEKSLQAMEDRLEKVRAAIAQITLENGKLAKVTASIGFKASQEGDTAQNLLAQVDGLLYNIKKSGRKNRVISEYSEEKDLAADFENKLQEEIKEIDDPHTAGAASALLEKISAAAEKDNTSDATREVKICAAQLNLFCEDHFEGEQRTHIQSLIQSLEQALTERIDQR